MLAAVALTGRWAGAREAALRTARTGVCAAATLRVTGREQPARGPESAGGSGCSGVHGSHCSQRDAEWQQQRWVMREVVAWVGAAARARSRLRWLVVPRSSHVSARAAQLRVT